MEYCDYNLSGIIASSPSQFPLATMKYFLKMLLNGLQYIHNKFIIHRDIKACNLLINYHGTLKIADFGLARIYSPGEPLSPEVVTIWYRAPELLLGSKEYSTTIDMWSCGCLMAEMILKEPLFKGKGELQMINLIFACLGTPNDTTWPGFSSLPTVKKMKFDENTRGNLRTKFSSLSNEGYELLRKLLLFDTTKRISSRDAFTSKFFEEEPKPSLVQPWRPVVGLEL